MAEAGETQNELMERLSASRLPAANRNKGLPARSDERTPTDEPIDPGANRETIQSRGKSPEEVLGDREEQQRRQPATTVADDADTGKQPAKQKAAAVRKWKYKDEELTLKEITERDLLDKVFATAGQYPLLQEKYQRLLEEKAAAVATPVPATPEAQAKAAEQAEHAHQDATLQVIRAYEPTAKKEIEFYVAKGLIEQDFVDAYPLGTLAMFAINLYHLDAIQAAVSKTEAAVEWIRGEVDYKKAIKTWNLLDGTIDAVAKRKNKIFEALKQPDMRRDFVAWLRKEVDLPTDKITEENIAKLWGAFNLEGVLAIADQEKEDETVRQPDRRRAAGDGNGARVETRETPELTSQEKLLEDMSNLRLPAE